jgi:hypothetical protein
MMIWQGMNELGRKRGERRKRGEEKENKKEEKM